MSSPVWTWLSEIGRGIGAAVKSFDAIRRGRRAAAEGIRKGAEKLTSVVWGYIGLLFLLGMTTAGLVLIPVGMLLLGHSLLRDTVDRYLVGGVLLAAVGMFYLVVPLVIVRIATRAALDRAHRQAERLARRIQGED